MRLVIARNGLPHYAARVIGEARRQLPEVEVTAIGTDVGVPYDDREEGLPRVQLTL